MCEWEHGEKVWMRRRWMCECEDVWMGRWRISHGTHTSHGTHKCFPYICEDGGKIEYSNERYVSICIFIFVCIYLYQYISGITLQQREMLSVDICLSKCIYVYACIYTCVCVCVCICVCGCVYVYLWNSSIHVCLHAWIYLCMFSYIRNHTRTSADVIYYIYSCTCIYLYAYVYMFMYMYVCVTMCAYIYMDI